MRYRDLMEKVWYGPSTEEVVRKIKTNCHTWLIQSKGLPCYRGDKHQTEDFYKATPRGFNDISGENVSMKLHNATVNLMKENGLEAHRGNAFYATGDKDQAIFYSPAETKQVFCVFPIGDFKFSWSTKVKDFHEYNNMFSTDDKIENELPKFIEQYYSDQDLYKALKSGNEIMILCNAFYAIDSDWYKDIKEQILS